MSASEGPGNVIPLCNGYYDINVTLSQNNQTATAVSWSKNEEQYAKKEASLGLYFLRTTLLLEDKVMIWNIYNTIREIEFLSHTKN